MKKLKLCIVLALVAMIAVVGTYAATQIYWSRTIKKSFKVIGIEAELLEPNLDGYKNKVVAANLDVDDKISLAIIAENFENVWLNVTWTSDAEGLLVDATGQYYTVYKDAGMLEHYDAVGDTFNVMGLNTINKTMMIWSPCAIGEVPGGLLMISFAFDTEAVTIAGDYVIDLTFEMGFA